MYTAKRNGDFVIFDITDLTTTFDMVKLMTHLEDSLCSDDTDIGLSFSCVLDQESTLTGVIVVLREIVNHFGRKLVLIEKDPIRQERLKNICEILGVPICSSKSLLKSIPSVAA
jgi:hypothetical protein